MGLPLKGPTFYSQCSCFFFVSSLQRRHASWRLGSSKVSASRKPLRRSRELFLALDEETTDKDMITPYLFVLSLIHAPQIKPDHITITSTGYLSGTPVQIQLEPIPDRHQEPYFLTSEAAQSFREMHAQAAIEGIELRVESAFRTHSQQVKLFYRHGKSRAAKPGYSRHQQGTAIDLVVRKPCKTKGLCRSLEYWWLRRNAHKYNFHQPLEHEPWHWVYIEPEEPL